MQWTTTVEYEGRTSPVPCRSKPPFAADPTNVFIIPDHSTDAGFVVCRLGAETNQPPRFEAKRSNTHFGGKITWNDGALDG